MTDPTTPPPPPPPPPGDFGAPPPPPPGGFGGPAPADNSGNKFGLISMILGIVSLVLYCIYAGLWLGIPAVILGVLGMKKANEGQATNKGMAIAGIVTGGLGILFFILQLTLLATMDWSQLQNLQNQ